MKNKAAVSLGKKGGSRTSEAKARTAKENGAKGGRPRKILVDAPVLNQSIISSVLD